MGEGRTDDQLRKFVDYHDLQHCHQHHCNHHIYHSYHNDFHNQANTDDQLISAFFYYCPHHHHHPDHPTNKDGLIPKGRSADLGLSIETLVGARIAIRVVHQLHSDEDHYDHGDHDHNDQKIQADHCSSNSSFSFSICSH